jgi:hypothetical protein
MVPAVSTRVKREARWAYQFRDVPLPADLPDYGELYYKSECQPLKRLKTLHTKTAEAKAHKLHFREWIELRDRARKDLYWLGHDCIATPESGSGFVEHVHREMLEQFVPKNFDGVYHKNWTLDEARAALDRQPREKEMLLLAPTGAFKSTANKIDCVQWMLNFPDVRIFIITGSGPLSKKFLREVKGFFCKLEGKPHTFFQALFPEYVIPVAEADTLSPLFSPARLHAQPGTPTLWVNSIDGAIAGWHCDVWKGDDVVNEDNSNNEDTRETLKQRYDNISGNRPDKWAFKDHLGTRYDPWDWYGSRLDEARRYPETNALKHLKRSAWTVHPEFAQVPIKLLQEHMVDLYFPEFMPFKLMIKKCRANEKNFRCQQLNEPAGGEVAVHFSEEDIKNHTILLSGVPLLANGEIRRPAIIWDTAHGDNGQSDWSAGAVGWCNRPTRTLFVLEVAMGKWKDSQVAVQVVELHWKWNALFSEVEKFHGWELFAAEVQRVSLKRYRRPVPLLWREADNSPGSKRNHIKGLETLLADDRLLFVDGDWMDLLTQQFVRFTGFSKRRKDDGPDAISRLQRLIPAETWTEVADANAGDRKAREAQELREQFARNQRDSEYTAIFDRATPPPPAPEPAAEQVQAAPASGPDWMFGITGIHL